MIQKIFGNAPFSSIAGYIVAGLMVANEMINSGVTNWWRIAIAAAIAVLGRVAGDDKKV